MARQNTNNEHDDTERALQEVLQAEKDAKRAVLDCEEQANARLAEARNRARLIGERADTRISSLEARCERAIGQRLDELKRADAEHAAAAHGPLANEAALEQAVAALAAELAGEADDTDEGASPPSSSQRPRSAEDPAAASGGANAGGPSGQRP